jgi:hypothetical protein
MTTKERLFEHYTESKLYFPSDRIVGIFLQGSQNYGLELPTSDVDSKLIVVPTFKDIALNRKPVSTTHVRANDEHIDFKDIRLYIETFRKQNPNFLEILFTDYLFLGGYYKEQWMRLVENREAIAHMNPFRAAKAIKGVALDKFHAMEHPYPTKIDIINKYGHDGKQTHHLIRVDDFATRFFAGEPYERCLIPTPSLVDELMAYKRHEIPLEVARKRATEVLEHITVMIDTFCDGHKDEEDEGCRWLLEDVSYNIMKIATLEELHK